ncbi:MAG: hypothetical protein OXC26_04520 [Albidovulum sp.]|nr:hypothetical protein [Albidovulum sp.]
MPDFPGLAVNLGRRQASGNSPGMAGHVKRHSVSAELILQNVKFDDVLHYGARLHARFRAEVSGNADLG